MDLVIIITYHHPSPPPVVLSHAVRRRMRLRLRRRSHGNAVEVYTIAKGVSALGVRFTVELEKWSKRRMEAPAYKLCGGTVTQLLTLLESYTGASPGHGAWHVSL